jgi:hypothetical protein
MRTSATNRAAMAMRLRVERFIWGQTRVDDGKSQKKSKNIFRKGERGGFIGENGGKIFESVYLAK